MVELEYEEVGKNCMYLYFPYRCKDKHPDALQHNRMTHSETDLQEEVRNFVKSPWKQLPLKMGSISH